MSPKVQPSGPLPARIFLCGEAPGEQEVLRNTPFVGPSGYELDRMLHEVGIMRSECFITNVCRQRPPTHYKNGKRQVNDIGSWTSPLKTCPNKEWQWKNGLWYSQEIAEGLELLEKEIALCQPSVIVAFGNLALWALSGNWSIKNWRGSLLQHPSGATLVPTWHPAYILRDWSQRSLAMTDLRRVAKVLREGPPLRRDHSYIIAPNIHTALSTLQHIEELAAHEPIHVSADIETRHGHIDCIGFGWSLKDAICLPFLRYGGADYWGEAEELELLRGIRRLFSNSNVLISGQNWSYDAQYILRHWGIKVAPAHDTMLGHHVCWPGTEKALDIQSSLYCEHHIYWKDENKEASLKQDDYKRWEYNCTDCVRTWEIAEVQVPMIEKLGLQEQHLFQHRMWHRAFDAMTLGIAVDKELKASLSHSLDEEFKQRQTWMKEVIGHELNIRSPKQLAEFFYKDLKLPIIKKRATGAITTDDEALTKLAVKEPILRPILRRIGEMRSLGVFRSTFVEAELDSDGRMRTAYNVAGTETFRFNSATNAFGSGLNLQNIPKGDEDDLAPAEQLQLPNIRKLFIPDPGYELFDTDLDSADLRVVVWESDCKEMKRMLAEGLKPYVEMAKEYYRDPRITKQHPKYGAFKSLAHGTNYLGSAKGIAPRIGLLVHEVERIQKWYYERFPEIKVWQDGVVEGLRRTHSVSNAWGYRRFYFDRIEGTLFNQAVAWIPQSTVGILINKIWDSLLSDPRSKDLITIHLQVHDSLVGTVPIARREEAFKALEEVANSVRVPCADPLHIPIGFKSSARSWGDC